MAKKLGTIDTQFLHHPLTIAIIVVRVTFALSMFISPVWGYVLTVMWDYLDGTVLLYFERISRKQYHYLDKNLDFVYLTVMFIIGLATSAAVPLLVLFVYRLIGHFLFMRSHKVMYFVLFPNFFEVLYVWVVLGNIVGFNRGMESTVYLTWLIVLFLLKELHEIGLHFFWANYLSRRDATGAYPIHSH